MLNNGITIVAKAITKIGSTFKIMDYQIVNGCQTSHVLYFNRDALSGDVFVPIKIIVTDNQDVTNDIIKATNWQTEVKKEAFVSLSPFHKKLEEFYATFDKDKEQRLYYERRSKQYEDQPIKKYMIVTVPTQIKAFLSMFLDEPHSTHRYYGEIFKANEYRLFREDHSYYPYYTSSYALFRLEDLFGKGGIGSKFKKFKYHMLLLLRLKVAGREMPPMNSRKMDEYCKPIMEVLWNKGEAQKVFEDTGKRIEEALTRVENQYNINRLRKFTAQVTELPDLDVRRGEVKYFNEKKGFGFIDIGEGDDVFVHYKSIKGTGYRTLNTGDQVSFKLRHSEKGLKAEEVEVINP